MKSVALYTECFGRNVSHIERMFLGLIYIDIPTIAIADCERLWRSRCEKICGLLAVPLTVPV